MATGWRFFFGARYGDLGTYSAMRLRPVRYGAPSACRLPRGKREITVAVATGFLGRAGYARCAAAAGSGRAGLQRV